MGSSSMLLELLCSTTGESAKADEVKIAVDATIDMVKVLVVILCSLDKNRNLGERFTPQ